MDSDLNSFIKLLCNSHSLYIESASEDSCKIFTDHASGISIVLEFTEANNFSFHFLQRTYDVVYNGDRSDAHVILSLMFASFIRLVGDGISCSFFDIAHPAVEDEIWGRYIMPEQTPAYLGISSRENLYQAIAEIIQIVAKWRTVFWQYAGCPCEECVNKLTEGNYRNYEFPNDLINSIEKVYKTPKHTNYGGRLIPRWKYIYDIDHEITIIHSESLSTYMEEIVKKANRKVVKIKGKNCTLFLDGQLKNVLHQKSNLLFGKLFKSLKDEKKKVAFRVIPFENMVLAVATPYIIALGRFSGFQEFKLQREAIRLTHNMESEFLFPISNFIWEDSPCPDQFEKLVRALLEREPNVKSVRIPAPINQADKGRDLIIEWNAINERLASEKSPPSTLIKVVGQCKASKKAVGKKMVLDIRDTIETHDSQGYFLAVSSQITAALTEKFEQLKKHGIWTEWWNREDIESRLNQNQDLIPQFDKVITVKEIVKFVEK